MGKRKRGGGQSVAALILGGVGAALAAAGVIVFVLVPRSLEAQRARIEGLAVSGAVALDHAAAGREVLLEGRISTAQPALFRDFVAYDRLERRRTEKGTESWSRKELRRPSLLISLADGTTRVVNDTYDLPSSTASWLESRSTNYIETEYRGLVAGDAVVIVGRTAPGGIEAEFVTPGTRNAYLQALAEGRVASFWLGGALSGIGAALVAAATVLTLRRT
jgi:hypothetical protein